MGKRYGRRRRRWAPPRPVLWKRSEPHIGVLDLGDHAAPGWQITHGLDAVVEELGVNVAATVTPETIDSVDVVLASMLSPLDIVRLVAALPERPRAKLVVGGQGAYAVRSYRHLVERVMFGRAEGAVDRVVLGDDPGPWVYRYEIDPGMTGRYLIRQAQRLLPGERSVGCPGRCTFCQYAATRRKMLGGDYDPGTHGAHILEDRWQHVRLRAGYGTTALDGWSEATRRRVRKPVSDAEIVEGLERIIRGLDKNAVLKTYMIVGYPWETVESVREDVRRFRELLGRVRIPAHRSGDLWMPVLVTPFSPEPLTALERERAQLVHWRREVWSTKPDRALINRDGLTAFVSPIMVGPLTLYRRVAANRGMDPDTLRRVAAARTLEQALEIGGPIHEAGAGWYVSDHLRPA